jgi:hypothetical protein
MSEIKSNDNDFPERGPSHPANCYNRPFLIKQIGSSDPRYPLYFN